MANYELPATEQEQAQFFADVREGFEQASARTGEMVRDFRIAGTSVRLRFAGDALTPAVIPGMTGLVPGGVAEPQCEIRIWDSESTGVALAPPPRPWRDFTGRGHIWGFDSPRYRSSYQWGEGSVNVMDRETRQAVYWVPSAKHLPEWVWSSPLRSILHWWMELNGLQLVHAAAMGQDGRGVLLPGRGGAGKSSTSLACLVAGMDFVSDDYLALALDPAPRVYRLYSMAKLDRGSLDLYPGLRSRCRLVDRPEFDKVVLYLEDGFGAQFKDSLPVNLVLRPRISGLPETTLAPVEACEIERALAEGTLLHLPHVGGHTVEILNRVAHEVPRAEIRLGTDRARIPASIQRTLDTRAEAPSVQARERRPFVSVIVHFRQEDPEEVRALADMLEAQGYPRTEFVVTAEGAACGMANDVARFPGLQRFTAFHEPVLRAEVWNRGIRESFAELLMVIEPGDRLETGALDVLVDACQREPDAAWVRGRPIESRSALRGALLRKAAFRECGLFHTNPLYQGREHKEWLQRAARKGLKGCDLDTVILHAAPADTRVPTHRPGKIDWDILKSQVNLRRQNTPE